jgi:hypothetical protein
MGWATFWAIFLQTRLVTLTIGFHSGKKQELGFFRLLRTRVTSFADFSPFA